MHMVQVFLFGAYKYPRELTWMVGVVLLLMTLGMAFTGQIMRFDQDAYWGLGIGASIAGRTPSHRSRRSSTSCSAGRSSPVRRCRASSRSTSSSFPALLMALVGLHLLLVLKLGINEWPMPGRVVSRETYRREYEALVARRRRPVLSRRGEEGHGVRRARDRRAGRVRGDLRSDRARRPARSDHHRHRADAGLLLPVDLRGARAAARLSRDDPAPDGSGGRRSLPARAAALLRHRREELAPAAGRGARRRHDLPDDRHAHLPRHVRARGRR